MSTAVRWSASPVAFVHSGCGAYAAAAADLMAAIGPEFMREQIAQLQTHRGGKLRELKLDAALGAHFELNLSKAHVDMLSDITAPLALEYGVPGLKLFASSNQLDAPIEQFKQEFPWTDVSVKTKLTPAQELLVPPAVGDKLQYLDGDGGVKVRHPVLVDFRHQSWPVKLGLHRYRPRC